MAQGATIFRFEIALADVDRGVFEDLQLRVARHPSESQRYFIVRMLARCLEHADGIELTKGVSDTEWPAIVIRDLEGGLSAWVEVGLPADKRVHKATARTERVVVYAHKMVADYIEKLRTADLRRAERVTVVYFDDEMLQALEDATRRSARWSLTRSDGVLYIEADGVAISGPVRRALLV